jgi:hypothetical protein
MKKTKIAATKKGHAYKDPYSWRWCYSKLPDGVRAATESDLFLPDGSLRADVTVLCRSHYFNNYYAVDIGKEGYTDAEHLRFLVELGHAWVKSEDR